MTKNDSAVGIVIIIIIVVIIVWLLYEYSCRNNCTGREDCNCDRCQNTYNNSYSNLNTCRGSKWSNAVHVRNQSQKQSKYQVEGCNTGRCGQLPYNPPTYNQPIYALPTILAPINQNPTLPLVNPLTTDQYYLEEQAAWEQQCTNQTPNNQTPNNRNTERGYRPCGKRCDGQCQEKTCLLPSPPMLTVNVVDHSIIASWNIVERADYYNVYLYVRTLDNYNIVSWPLFRNILYLDATQYTFFNVPAGIYRVIVISGNNCCGIIPTINPDYAYNQSDDIYIDTPPLPTPCNFDSQCLSGALCTNGVCVCMTPTVIRVRRSSDTWPTPSNFIFDILNAGPLGASITFDLVAYGTAGVGSPTYTFSGLTVQNPSNTFFGTDPRVAGSIWLCTGTTYGCDPTCGAFPPFPSVNFLIRNVRISNECGLSSGPTCWLLTNVCGGSTDFAQQTC